MAASRSSMEATRLSISDCFCAVCARGLGLGVEPLVLGALPDLFFGLEAALLEPLEVAVVTLDEGLLVRLPRAHAVDLVVERPGEHDRQEQRRDEQDGARRAAHDGVGRRRVGVALSQLVGLRSLSHG
jgi:hypothetical protein